MNYYAWCDASHREKESMAGFIIKDQYDNVIESGWLHLSSCKNSFQAEFKAIVNVLRIIVKKNLSNITIFNDCRTAIELITNKKMRKRKIAHSMKQSLSYIDSQIKTIENLTFRWVSRKKNKEAHRLSQHSNLEMMPKTDEYPLEKIGWKRYQITNIARESFRLLCPTSYKKCKSIEQIDYKITRFVEIGNITIHSDYFFTSCYWNIQIKVIGDIVVSLEPNSAGKNQFVSPKKKKEWDNLYPFTLTAALTGTSKHY